MPEPEECPASEDLAALVDGSRLDGGLQDLVHHLRRCPACYAVFTEARKLRHAFRGYEDPDEIG
jgi:hypothetical protein